MKKYNEARIADLLYLAHPKAYGDSDFDPVNRLTGKGKIYAAGILHGLIGGLMASGFEFKEACVAIRENQRYIGLDKSLFPLSWAHEFPDVAVVNGVVVRVDKLRAQRDAVLHLLDYPICISTQVSINAMDKLVLDGLLSLLDTVLDKVEGYHEAGQDE